MSDHHNLTTSDEIYNDLIHYLKYASSAYALVCPRPNGKHLVLQFSNISTDIQGYVARDEKRRELVVAFRGSTSLANALLDTQLLLVPLITPGIATPSGVRVHSGFLLAWDSVAVQVLAIIALQMRLHPGLSIVTTGHSLGGALSTLAAITLKHEYPESKVRTYSYGAPRTGNKAFAEYMNAQFGHNAFRAVHTTDGVPTMIPTSLGYHHHGIEYWQSTDPASKDTTFQCSDDGEDPTCSASIPTRAINPAHWKYFGILATTPFCL